jgi:hypothetical protein
MKQVTWPQILRYLSSSWNSFVVAGLLFPQLVTAAIASEIPVEIPAEIPAEIPSEILSELPSEVSSETPSEVSAESLSETPSEISSETLSETIFNDPSQALEIASEVQDASAAEPAELEEMPVLRDANLLQSAGSDDPMAQVTSVSQLSDVQPTDWAFQALQSLVERYGCIAGYPDGTYRGNRAMTRYEFAAGLNACLDRLLELRDFEDVDFAAIRRLQEEFAAELAQIRGRVDSLESRTAELEANQFSTTTKLSGSVYFHLNGAAADGDVLAEGAFLDGRFVANRDPLTGRPSTVLITDDPEITFSNLVWLNLNTSFTGSDSLVMQLASGDAGAGANFFTSAGLFNTYGVPFTLQSPAPGNDVILRELFYSFPVVEQLQLTVGPRINWYRYFDNNRFTFFGTGANSFNSSGGTQVNTLDRGAGAVAEWFINDTFELTLGYLAENTEFLPSPPFNTATDPSEGLFGGTYTITAELDVYLGDLTLRGLYTRSRLNAVDGLVGGALGEPIYGFVDDGFGGPIHDAYADTFLVNFDWLITDGIGLFGRYSYGNLDINPVIIGRPDGEVEAQALQLGLALPDLAKEGALLTFSYLKPFALLDGRDFLVSGGGDGGVQYEFELSYYYPLTDNIALMPSFYFIGNANNFDENDGIFVGNLQTQFRF